MHLISMDDSAVGGKGEFYYRNQWLILEVVGFLCSAS